MEWEGAQVTCDIDNEGRCKSGARHVPILGRYVLLRV